MRGVVRRVQRLVGRSPGRTWILSYHLVEGGTGLAIDIPKDRFLRHLELLGEQAEVMGLRELVRELQGGAVSVAPDSTGAARRAPAADRAPTPNRPRVVLTFDDAFVNFYEVVLPLLVERNLPATLYVPPGFVNGDGNHPLYHARFGNVEAMSWNQLRDATAAGIEIGSHTYRHTNLARLSPSIVADEMGRSQVEIEHRLGVRPTSVCYPEGFVTAPVARAAGRFYESGVTGGGRAVGPSGIGRPLGPSGSVDLLRLPRLPLRADISPEALMLTLGQPVSLEEWAADKVRQVRRRVVARN